MSSGRALPAKSEAMLQIRSVSFPQACDPTIHCAPINQRRTVIFVDESDTPPFNSRMPPFDNPFMVIFEEGIRGRSTGIPHDANPYPDAAPEREAWDEGWRLYDTLREPPPTEEDILESLVWRRLH